MSEDLLRVKIQPEMGSEEAYFKEKEQKMIKDLREKAGQEATARYCKEHKHHCFRCGTKSLVEIDRGDMKVDICVNDNCGAVHLDPGELEQILKDEKGILIIRKSLFRIFK